VLALPLPISNASCSMPSASSFARTQIHRPNPPSPILTQRPSISSKPISIGSKFTPIGPSSRPVLRKVLKPKRDIHTAKELSDATQRLNQFRLVTAIHRARQWHAGLVSGTIPDIDAIAAQEKKSARNIRTLLSLAFFAPDIIELIVDERLKVDTTVSDLSANLPVSWAEQRRYVGMTTSLTT
jgi:hypothetical protein